MSDRNSLDPTRGAAIMRHALERVIRPELQRTVRTVDRATAGGEKIRVERSVGYVDEQRLVLTPTIAAASGGGGTVGDPHAPVIVMKASPSFFTVSATSFTAYTNISGTITLESGVEYTVAVLGTHTAQGAIEGRAFFGATSGTILNYVSDTRTPFNVSLVVGGVVGTGTAQSFGVQVRKTDTTNPSFGYGTVTCIAIPAAMAIGGGSGGLAALRVESNTTPITTPLPTAALDFGAGFVLSAEDAAGTDTHTDEVNVALDFGTGTNQVARGDHTHALSDLSNVSTVTPASGQVLQYTGSQWAPATVAGTASPSASMVTPYPGAHLGPLNHAAGPITNANSFGSGWVYLYPFDVPETCTVNWLGIAKGNTASTNVKIGLWASGADRFPTGAPLRSNVVATGTGTGLVGASVSPLTLTPGRYWLGFSLQAAVNLVGISNWNSTIPLIAPTAAEITATNVVRETGFGLAHTYTNALPTNPSFASRSFFLNSVPSVWARVA